MSDTTNSPATLADMGITKDQSSNWQALASMSDEHFEVTVEAAKDTGRSHHGSHAARSQKGKPKGKPKTGKKADAIRRT